MQRTPLDKPITIRLECPICNHTYDPPPVTHERQMFVHTCEACKTKWRTFINVKADEVRYDLNTYSDISLVTTITRTKTGEPENHA